MLAIGTFFATHRNALTTRFRFLRDIIRRRLREGDFVEALKLAIVFDYIKGGAFLLSDTIAF